MDGWGDGGDVWETLEAPLGTGVTGILTRVRSGDVVVTCVYAFMKLH
jgi:hypothetical protein